MLSVEAPELSVFLCPPTCLDLGRAHANHPTATQDCARTQRPRSRKSRACHAKSVTSITRASRRARARLHHGAVDVTVRVRSRALNLLLLSRASHWVLSTCPTCSGMVRTIYNPEYQARCPCLHVELRSDDGPAIGLRAASETVIAVGGGEDVRVSLGTPGFKLS